MTEKQKFMVFRALFLFEVHIQQRWYLTGGNSSWSFIWRKKTDNFKILKKSVMATQKYKNILLQAALKDFWSSANPKLKKLSLPELSLLQNHIEENARMEVLGSFVCKWFKILFYSEFSENLTMKVCKPMKGIKVIWWCHKIFWSLSWTSCYNDWYSYEPAMIEWCEVLHITLQKFQFINLHSFRFTEFRHFLRVVEKYA